MHAGIKTHTELMKSPPKRYHEDILSLGL